MIHYALNQLDLLMIKWLNYQPMKNFDLEQKWLNQLSDENNNWNSSLRFYVQLGIIVTNISGEESI